MLTNIAYAIIILNDEPATPGVMHAVTLLEHALPPAGTAERRAAFKEAHERIARSAA